jgi:hypothetical protein
LITITDLNGFDGQVTLTLSPLPRGVRAVVKGTGNRQKILFQAGPKAAVGSTTVTVTGTSGTLVHTLTFTLVVQAAGELRVSEQ